MTTTNTQKRTRKTPLKSPKSGLTALLLCVFFGVFGVHRLYVGKIWTGLLMLITFGCLGIWSLVDAFSIINGTFEDKQARPLTCLSNPSSFKRAIAFILAAILEFVSITLFIILLVMYLTNSLVKTVERQLEALRSNDLQASYSFTARAFQNNTSLENFKQLINQYPALKNNESMSVSKRDLDNNQGKIAGTLKSKDGSVIRVEYLLIKEDDQWKILAIIINPKE